MNKKISGRYRFLMRVDFGRKHFLQIQAATYFLCFFLLCSMNIWIENMAKIRQAEEAERYGSWHYGLIDASEEEIALIEKNRMLIEFGQATVYGNIYGEDDHYMGGIGTLEESMLQLCGMKLMSGHLPQAVNEVALEQNTLEQLGLSYVQGGEITLMIRGAEETSLQEATYILCGILQSNSAYTEAGSYLPVAIVSEEGAAVFTASGQQELFIQMVEGCDVVKVREELSEAISREFFETSENIERQWIQNAFVYGEDFRRSDTGDIRLIVSVIGYVVILTLAFTCTFRERKWTDLLRTLGMLDREIVFLFVGEQILIWLAGLLLGLVFSRLGTGLLLDGYMRSQNLRTEISYPVSSIEIICLFSSLSLLAGTLCGTVCTRIRGAYRNPREMNYRVLEKGKLTPLNGDMKKALLKRELRVRRNAYIGLFCMHVLMLSVAAFCTAWIYQHYQGYIFNKRLYVCDYIIESSSANFSIWGTNRFVDANLLNRIRHMEGVEKVETVYWNSQVEILDEDVRSGAYYQSIESYYSARRGALTSSLITLEGVDTLTEELAVQVDVGAWDWEKLEAGEEVVIYLPLQRLSGNGIVGIPYSMYLQDQVAYDAEYASWQERGIEVGDMLLIQVGDIKKEVKIGGIIYDLIDFENRNMQIMNQSYDIYCGMKLFRELVGEEAADSRTYIYMEKGQTAAPMAEQMENMLNRSHVSWENIRGRVRPLLEYHKNGILFGVALLAGFSIFFLFIIISFLNREMEIIAYKNQLILNLGAYFDGRERPFLHWYYWSRGLGTLTALFFNSLIIVLVLGFLEHIEGFYLTQMKLWEIYPLLLGIQVLLLIGEWQLQKRILKKKEKISKNIYYFVP